MESYSGDPEEPQSQNDQLSPSSNDDAGSISSWKRKGRKNTVIFVFICALASFFLNFAAFINLAPQLRIFETVICRNYYDKHDPDLFPYPEEIPEAKCKISPVQSEIALLQALKASFDAIPGIFLLIPYGRLADSPKYGRKKTIILSVVGVLIEVYFTLGVCLSTRVIPLRAIWFGSVFLIIGGGLGVTNAMVITMISDVVDATNRSTAFFQASLAQVVAQLIAPTLGSTMMAKHGPWVPYFLGVGSFTLCFPLLLTIPETIHMHPEKRQRDSASENPNTAENIHLHETPNNTGGFNFKKLLSHAREESKSVFGNRLLLILLSTAFISIIGRKQTDLLLLYASTRYEIPLAKAGYIHTLMAAVSIVLLLIVLPGASSFLTRRFRLDAFPKDLWLSRGSVILLTIGCFIIGLAPNLPSMLGGLVLYTLGCGFDALCLTLISIFVDPSQSARMFSIYCLITMFGSLVGSPSLAALFNLGLRLGNGWIGLPFFGTGIIYIVVTSVVWLIRLPDSATQGVKTPRSSRHDEEERLLGGD